MKNINIEMTDELWKLFNKITEEVNMLRPDTIRDVALIFFIESGIKHFSMGRNTLERLQEIENQLSGEK